MKQENKELIKWIKSHISVTVNDDVELHHKAFDFLNSLPKIESHLCNGGYIQDRNGTPCCHGDKIKFKFSEQDFNEHWKDKYAHIEYGELKFDVNDKKFVILFGEDKNGFDWIDWNGAFEGCEWFEKVEK